jgi:hypothetical protein
MVKIPGLTNEMMFAANKEVLLQIIANTNIIIENSHIENVDFTCKNPPDSVNNEITIRIKYIAKGED